jgi:UV DNA damage endonuclease
MTNKRIGFACKLSQLDSAGKVQAVESCNTRVTTISWLNRQDKKTAHARLQELVQHNLNSAHNLVNAVGKMPELKRMVRLSSDLLPAYTHADWSSFYDSAELKNYIQSEFAKIGELARANKVRLSFHPGQFCCIVSENPGVVENSLQELEYHASMAEWMGYGQNRLDFKINIHLSGKLGFAGFQQAYTRMSPVLQGSLTLENDEFQAGLDKLLPLAPYVGIVLDIHHHFINTGEYVQNNDSRIKIIQDSWQGHRPVIHYSQSQWEYLSDFVHCMPQLEQLLTNTTKSKLRAHSEFYNHDLLNQWAASHLDWADVMTESKSKNIGVEQFCKFVQ